MFAHPVSLDDIRCLLDGTDLDLSSLDVITMHDKTGVVFTRDHGLAMLLWMRLEITS